jgi:hypothetical protein
MTRKKIAVSLRPGFEKAAEGWVHEPLAATSKPSPEKLKRLTIDIPEHLHRELKVKAAGEGVKMVDLLREWIEEKCRS